MSTRYELGNHVKVTVDSAWKGEIGVVTKFGRIDGTYEVEFGTGEQQTFAWYELKKYQLSFLDKSYD